MKKEGNQMKLCTCGGGSDTIYCPLYVRLILSVAHQQSSLPICEIPIQENKVLALLWFNTFLNYTARMSVQSYLGILILTWM